MLSLNFCLNGLLICLDCTGQLIRFLVKLILLKLAQSFFLLHVEKLLLHINNLLLSLALDCDDLLDVGSNCDLLIIDTVLVCLVVVTLFSQLLPG